MLVVNQVSDDFEGKVPHMFQYLVVIKSLLSGFTDFKITYIPREENIQADILSKVALTDFPNLAK